jgi:hypothetical protein
MLREDSQFASHGLNPADSYAPAPMSPGSADIRTSIAAMSFWLAAEYDRLRLTLYQNQGPRRASISIKSIGGVTLLRFEDVGYFNRVYADDHAVADRLEMVERFFDGSPHGCRLATPTLSAHGRLARACAARGWWPAETYAWLATSRPVHPSKTRGDFEIRQPRADEQESFLYTYLAGFGADPARHAMAVENMRHLFSVPNLHFLFALHNGQPAGIGMLYRHGRAALLCAGATLPSYRARGCHEALLAARIHLARDLECTSLHSWVLAGSQSHANMADLGMQTVGTTLTWRFPPYRGV